MEPVARVREHLARFPYRIEIMEFEESTHTAELAARAVGVGVGQIAKSLLFVADGRPVMVVTSGDVKVSTGRLKQHLGVRGKVRMADPETAAAVTGYPPGGLCPFDLPEQVRVLVDVSMKRFPVVYVAAGSPRSAAPVTAEQLLEITGGEWCDVCQGAAPG